MNENYVGLFFALALAACGGGGIHVAHPAVSGRLEAVSATYLDRTESGLARQQSTDPHALDDTATLVRLDGQSVCFDVVTRLIDRAGSGLAVPAVTLDPSTAVLTYDGGTLRSPTILPRQVRFGPPQAAAVTNYFVEDENHEVHSETTSYEYEVVSAGGILCFEHDGAMPVTNRHLRLSYTQLSWTDRFDFQLDADPAPSAWPPGPIVAPGYEPLAR